MGFCYVLYRQDLPNIFLFLLFNFTIVRIIVNFFISVLNTLSSNETTIASVSKDQIYCIFVTAIIISLLILCLFLALLGKVVMNFFIAFNKGLLNLKTYYFILLFFVYAVFTLVSYGSIDLLPESVSLLFFSISPETKNCSSFVLFVKKIWLIIVYL